MIKKNVLVKSKTAIGKWDRHVYANSEFVIDKIILLFITIYVRADRLKWKLNENNT